MKFSCCYVCLSKGYTCMTLNGRSRRASFPSYFLTMEVCERRKPRMEEGPTHVFTGRLEFAASHGGGFKISFCFCPKNEHQIQGLVFIIIIIFLYSTFSYTVLYYYHSHYCVIFIYFKSTSIIKSSGGIVKLPHTTKLILIHETTNCQFFFLF
jgi:hypothetical protein